jgi:hypothetical protein
MRVSVRRNIRGLFPRGLGATPRPAPIFRARGARTCWGRAVSALVEWRTGNRSIFNFDRRRVVEQCSHGRSDGWCRSCSSVRHFPWRSSVAELHQALIAGLLRGVIALAGVFVLAAVALGQSSCFVFSYTYGTFPTGAAACAALAADYGNPAHGGYGDGRTASVTACSFSGAPSVAGQSTTATIEVTFSDGSTFGPTSAGSMTSVSGACATSCSTAAGTYNVLTTGAAAAAGSTVCGLDNCSYTYGPANTFRTVIGCGGSCKFQSAQTTGASCSGGATPVATTTPLDTGSQSANCQLLGSATVCATQSATGTYCGTYNGDQVCVGAVPTGTCAVYSSGGAACTVAGTGAPATPPAPNNGTAGTPATPDLTVSQQTMTGTTTTAYYGAVKTGGSTTAVNGAGTGAAGNKNGSPTGTGTGTGTSGSGPGDCMLQPGESGADDPAGCTGTLPSLTRSDSVQSNIQALYTGIGASPIVSALAAISSNVPSAGACPTASVTLTTLSNHSYDFLQTACTIFAADLSTLITISDTIWAILGVLIVMSA